jgi:hypothetical protein
MWVGWNQVRVSELPETEPASHHSATSTTDNLMLVSSATFARLPRVAAIPTGRVCYAPGSPPASVWPAKLIPSLVFSCLAPAGPARFAFPPWPAADRLARSCRAQCGNRPRRDRLWLHGLPRPLSRRQAWCVFFVEGGGLKHDIISHIYTQRRQARRS